MRRTYLTLIAVFAMWGTIPVIVRQLDLPSAAIVVSRLAIAATLFSGLLAAGLGTATSERPRPPRRARLQTAASALVLGVHWLALFGAYQRASVGTVILITYLAPVGVAALAPSVLDERHERHTLGALALAVVGLVLVTAPAARSGPTTGLVLAGVAAVTFAALILISKPLATTIGPLRLARAQMAGAALLVAPVALLANWGEPSASWWWLLVLGVVHTAAGYSLYLRALERVPATHAAILGYIEPVVAVVAAWVMLGERPALATAAGAVLIVGAGIALVGHRAIPAPEEVADVPG